jgi:hypothetical protein
MEIEKGEEKLGEFLEVPYIYPCFFFKNIVKNGSFFFKNLLRKDIV